MKGPLRVAVRLAALVAALWVLLAAAALRIEPPAREVLPIVGNRSVRALDVEPGKPWTVLVLADIQGGFKYLDDLFDSGEPFEPRALLMLGDISDHPHEGYIALPVREILLRHPPARVFAVPGNHDRWGSDGVQEFMDWFGDTGFDFRIGRTRFLGIDNSQGAPSDAALETLRDRLADSDRSGERVILALHRAPLPDSNPTRESHLDVVNQRRLLDLLRAHRVGMVLAGHAHEASNSLLAGTQLVVAPSSGDASLDSGLTPISYLVLRGSDRGLSFELRRVPRRNSRDLAAAFLHQALGHIQPYFRARPVVAWGVWLGSALYCAGVLGLALRRRPVAPGPASDSNGERTPPGRAFPPALGALSVLPMALVVALQLCGPVDLDNNDQARQSLYVLDILQHRNWILPLEHGSIPATKPPLHAWLAAGLSLASGGPSEHACRAPAALAAIATAWLIFAIGAERFGSSVGLAAASIFALTHLTARLSTQVRPDMLLAFLVALAFFALHRAERARPRGMAAVFWAALSLSILAKGPVGPLLILAPLAVPWFTRDTRAAWRPLLCSSWAWLLVVPAAWAALAYSIGGAVYIDRVVLPETVDRVLGVGRHADERALPGQLVLSYLAQASPWSWLALLALPAAFRREARRDHALLGAWLLVGLVVLNLSRGQRPDYLLPLLPASSLLAAAGLSQARSLCGRAWPGLLGLYALGCLLLGALAIAQATASLPPLARLGPGWGLALVAAGLCFGWGARATASDRSPLHPVCWAAALVALLVLQQAYGRAVSREARVRRAPDIASFAGELAGLRHEGDEISILGGVRNSLRFIMRDNEPPLSPAELTWFGSRDPRRRSLLVTRSAGARELEAHWAGHYRVLLRRSVEEDGELVAVEWLRGES